MKPDLRTLAGASRVMEHMMALAKVNMERDGELQPVAFVFTTYDPVRRRAHPPDILCVGVKGGFFTDAKSKDDFDHELRRIARETRACAVGLIAEIWSVTAAQLAPDQQAHAEEHGLGDHPDRVEIARLTLEHIEGLKAWTAPIIRPPEHPDRPTLGEFVEEHMKWSLGRFANLLPGSAPKPTAKA